MTRFTLALLLVPLLAGAGPLVTYEIRPDETGQLLVEQRTNGKPPARYRVDLDREIARGGNLWTASRMGEYRSIGFDRLLRLPKGADSAQARVHFTPGKEVAFATGLATEKGQPADTYRFRFDQFHDLPFLLVGPLRRKIFTVGGATIDLVWEKGADAVGSEALFAWVDKAARAVTTYYARFPAPHALVFLRAGEGHGMQNGKSFGDGGAVITGTLGTATNDADLLADWVLTHEMVHQALPLLPRAQHWLEEGLATYVEPFARLQIGDLTAQKVWGDLVDGLPNGLPVTGDRGLDRTPTWGRTYWGGALFCLLADTEISRRTQHRHGLRDALRAILTETGGMAEHSTIQRVLAIGDRAVGVPVLSELYRKMKDDPSPVDLQKLWRTLGVKRSVAGVEVDDSATDAATRAALSRAN